VGLNAGQLTLTKLDINSIEESVVECIPNSVIREWTLGCRRHVIAGREIQSNQKGISVSEYEIPFLRFICKRPKCVDKVGIISRGSGLNIQINAE